MLKVVVFDGGYGGELFADKLEAELPVVKVLRVIDWRHADDILKSSRAARQAAMKALRPYIGKADLIIIANYFLTSTSLKYFKRKFKDQKFIGLKMPQPTTFVGRPTIALTTRALARTTSYHNYKFRLNRRVETLCLDKWARLVDDGELTDNMIYREFEEFRRRRHYTPKEVILLCSQFNDITDELKQVLGYNLKIYDGFSEAISEACKALKIRGRTGKKKKK